MLVKTNLLNTSSVRMTQSSCGTDVWGGIVIKMFQGFTNCTGYHLAIAVINFLFHRFLDLCLNTYLQNKFCLTTQYQTGRCIWCFLLFIVIIIFLLFFALFVLTLKNRQSLMVLLSLLVKSQEITSGFISKVKI